MTTSELQQHKKVNYLGVFWLLAGLTGIEIAVTYLPIPQVPTLVSLALIKASLVAMYYMHLKIDQKIFRMIFLSGILMGVILIISFMLLFAPIR
jgi:caa(3)-type oxidase subunit IV